MTARKNEIPITFFTNATAKQAFPFTVEDCVHLISADGLKPETEKYRAMAAGKAKDNAKKQMRGVCWSVSKYKDNHRLAANCEQHSGLICIDIDKLDTDKYQDLIKTIPTDPYTHICFISPSGNGIKVVIRIEADAAKHLAYFHSIAEYYLLTYGITIDSSGKDVSRLCFCCYDPQCKYYPNSKTFELRTSEKLFIAQSEAPVTQPIKLTSNQQQNLRKNTGITTNDVFEFTQNIKQYTEGNRNQFVHLFACNCNRKGISQLEAESFALGFATDLDAKEVKDTVNSAYKHHTHEHGKFAPKAKNISANTGIKNLAGSTNKPLPDSNRQATRLAGKTDHPQTDAVQRSGHQSADSGTAGEEDFIRFWNEAVEEDKAGKQLTKYSLDYIRYFDFLESQGFYRLQLPNNKYDLIRFKDNICTPQMTHNIQDHLNQWCKSNNELGVLSMLRKGAKTYFALNQFDNLNYKTIEFAKDTHDTAFYYFRNGIAEVTERGIEFVEYKQHNKSIWRSQIIDHDFIPLPSDLPVTADDNIDFDAMPCEFAKFISRAASNPQSDAVSIEIREKRYFSFCSSIGYMLHDHKTNISKAIIAVDHKLAMDRTEQNGGTGKSIVGNSFKYLKKIAMIDGREFKEDYPFRFDMLETDTKIIVMQDCRHNLDFGSFFVPITGDFTYNRRNIGFRTIKYEDSPKFWFDSNFTFKGEGNSHRRRQHVIEFDDYYSEEHTPYDDFSHYMFTDWDSEEMNRFYNFMLQCVQIYLAEGLLPYQKGNYDERKLTNECPVEFIDFMDAKDEKGVYLIQRNREILKVELLKQWTEKCRELNMQNTTSHMFSKFVKKYAKTRGLFFHNRKTNGKEYYALAETENATITAYQSILF
ncbi:MAG: BT4734/BF3469 family protein [Sediminibacterium sp.]|nr:BT4734/BF3469 family protein [Sediminibacterium sp.]